MGMSDDPNAMQFPYIESDQDFHALDNLVIQRSGLLKRKVKLGFKKGEFKVEAGTIRYRNTGARHIKEQFERGEINEREALTLLLSKIGKI